MADPRFPQPEQDAAGDGDLPAYDFLAAEAGPNSRFGRWRSWVEKRAAERYADLTPDTVERQRARGWGEDILDHGPGRTTPQLGIRTENLTVTEPPNYATSSVPSNPSPVPPPINEELLAPSHLRVSQFGSRFLPHSTAPIRCVLPLLADRLVLIGHDDGLSMLNMFPKEWTDDGLSDHGPSGAQAKVIWEGEAVYQLTLLEVDHNGTDTPSGVVLALVGSCREDECSSRDVESTRSLRMYSLSSIISLAKWAASNQYTQPLRVRGSTPGNPHRGTIRKGHHKSHRSVTKGLRSLNMDGQSQASPSPFRHDSMSPVQSSPGISPSTSLATNLNDEFRPPMTSWTASHSMDSIEETWDLVDDLPLRWASDYVSLAISGSRLANTSVVFYDIWSDPSTNGRKGALLAVATKSTVLLYETPKGERAFRFVKEFYVPSPPRAMRFVYQSTIDPMSRSMSDVGGSSNRTRTSPTKLTSHYRSTSSSTAASLRYSSQLSLFILFEKKSGIIRISDASVGEVELNDEGPPPAMSAGAASLSPTASIPSSNSRRNRSSWDGFGFIREKPNWILPTQVELSSVPSTSVYLLTRSRKTHIIQSPLPADLHNTPPFRILTWASAPTHVEARVCRPYAHDQEDHPPFLQLIAFGEDGIEVQEINLNQLTVRRGKGKGKGKITANANAPIHAVSDVLGGETAPLCVGGYWHRPIHLDQADLCRTDSVMSYMSALSYDSNDTEELAAKFMSERGIYGWVRKGHSDWRVFWVGGTGREEAKPDSL